MKNRSRNIEQGILETVVKSLSAHPEIGTIQKIPDGKSEITINFGDCPIILIEIRCYDLIGAEDEMLLYWMDRHG